MPIPPRYEPFWAAAERLQPTLDRARFLEAFAFGDSEPMATALAELVLRGVKRATASLAWTYAHDAKPVPQAGDLSIVTSWAGAPLCLIETAAVDVVPFAEVSEEFARVEGEDGGSLEAWRRNHRRFFAGECRRIGRTPSEHMPVVCERFRVVYPPPPAEGGTAAGR
jgi:uncharacterized protein YhfF